MSKSVVMIGDALEGHGGISAVLRTYRDYGIFDRWGVICLSSFDGPSASRQMRVMIRTLLRLLFLMMSQRISLAHLHSASRGSFWRTAVFSTMARAFSVPYVIHIHSGEFSIFFHNECGKVSQRIVRSVLKRSTAVFCLTEGWRRIVQEIEPSAKVLVLPNPVVVPHICEFKVRTRPPTILYLGWISERKGVFDLLEAVPLVLSRCPDCRFVMAGSGSIEAAKRRAAGLGVEAHVQFTGWITGASKDQMLRDATLVVLPSHFEAFGLCLIEAMAYGKAVLGTRVGGIPEVVEDGTHGVLVPPSSPVALAEAMIELISNEERLRAMGFAGHKYARQRYCVSRISGMLDRYYEEMGLTANAQR